MTQPWNILTVYFRPLRLKENFKLLIGNNGVIEKSIFCYCTERVIVVSVHDQCVAVYVIS